MKSIAILLGLFAAGAIAAPIKIDDSFNYTNNIDNAVDVEDARRAAAPIKNADSFNYTNNINNAVDVEDARRAADYEDDAFKYTDNIDNASDIKEVGDGFNYTDNLNNAADVKDVKDASRESYEHVVTDADGKLIYGHVMLILCLF
jgi:hypothetical protein